MSDKVEYENKYDAEVEDRLRKPLEQIVSLPKEERLEAFWKEIGSKAARDELQLFLLRAHNELFYKSVFSENTGQEFVREKTAQNDFNAVVWQESLKTTIEQFQFDGVKFIVKLKNNYKNAYNKEKDKWELDIKTGGRSFSKGRSSGNNRKAQIAKYYKIYEGVFACMKTDGEDRPEEELRQKTRKRLLEMDNRCTENLLDEIEELWKQNLVELYAEYDGEELNLLDKESYKEANTFFGIDPEKLSVLVEKQTETNNMINAIIDKIRTEFGLLNVERRECYRAFLTRDILTYLKLETGQGPNKEEEKNYELCKGKYRYTECPAGDIGFYEVLKDREVFFMDNLFHQEYIQMAIEDRPELLTTLYGIYYNLLRGDFKFSNVGIEAVTGLTKQKVSRWFEAYAEFKKEKYRVWRMLLHWFTKHSDTCCRKIIFGTNGLAGRGRGWYNDRQTGGERVSCRLKNNFSEYSVNNLQK